MALRTEKSVLAVGVAYSEQEVADVPCDDTDALLDWVVTDREVIATGAGL
jgi:5-formyltetrahydrofolate cyclo-ligase